MTILHARFAVLACLCAALPLVPPFPVEAAHLHGRYSREMHAAVSHSQRLTRTHDGSFFGRPTATAHRHDDNGNGHRARDHRASEHPPPNPRRYRGHGHSKVHNQQGQDPHDHIHHNAPRSAFARSRYRREPALLGRRSSVYVPGEHGDTYLVSRTPSRNWEHTRTDTDKQASHVFDRRQVDESNLIMGRIDIMGTVQSPGSTLRLASLSVDPTPIDWTSDQSSAKAFPLNASTTNQTQFIMIPMDEPSNAAENSIKHVTLATGVFDASSADMVMYCATYDPDPSATSALLMTPCTGTIQSTVIDPCADDGNDASSSTPHESQIFSYDPSSGQIEPISATAISSGTGNNPSDPTSCTEARVRRDNGNSTTSGSVTPSSTSTSTAPASSASQQARNVTLVYVAAVPEVPAPSSSSSNTTNTTHASIGQAAALTTTITTTVVLATTPSAPSTRTVTPAQAAVSVSVPTSSIPSQSATTTVPSAVTTATAARPSLSPLSSVSTTATSRAPGNADESLEVEIVGVVPSTATSSSSTSATVSTTMTTTTSSYSSQSASATLDAQAVASSIAREMVSRRAPAIVSVTIT